MTPYLAPDSVHLRLTARLGPPNALAVDVLTRLCGLYRLDTLAGLVAARHGWLGASFSAMELLAVVYARHIPEPGRPLGERGGLLLSKGHAAMAHYAVLASRGAFARSRLLTYKAADGLTAHSDRAIPGVDTDSGSLGQGLSKAVGLALANERAGRAQPTFVLLGDGELQEGQVFEALLTLRTLAPPRCVAIIDRNGLQTDSRTADIKDADDWNAVLAGVGLPVRCVDGHDVAALLGALDDADRLAEPLVVVADTVKGYGSERTRMPAAATARRAGVWHGRVPEGDEYAAIAAELVASVGDAELTADFDRHRGAPGSARSAPPAVGTVAAPPATAVGSIPTGAAFGEALLRAAEAHPTLVVLDADLEKSCRVDDFAKRHGDRFVEVGISEQDMVSLAAGLALGGRLPVTNTYASFYKRAADQVAACVVEGLPVVLAGHYAGIDYFTDGASHQSLTDVALMRSVAGVDVFEPLTAAETAAILEHVLARHADALAAGRRARPAYVRLHRTPLEAEPPLPAPFRSDDVYRFPGRSDGSPTATRIVTAGPHMLELALAVQRRLADAGRPVDVAATSTYDLAAEALGRFARGAERIVTLEDGLPRGGLADLVATVGERTPVRIGARATKVGSTRTLADMLAAHGLDLETVTAVVAAEADSRGKP